ncbi:MAG TPA: flavohemoglobin expression-modulating QEGLA motif protein [Polyangiaceae bacterium]|nr:flavohemoglobin expression-modulating QEGLA motif protein [Polyangiaceae bacterium]
MATPFELQVVGPAEEPAAAGPLGAVPREDELLEDDEPADGSRVWRSYKEKIAGLAQRIVDAQRPIRILDGIKWRAEVFEAFRASGFKQLPEITYPRAPFDFDPGAKKDELRQIETDVRSQLGETDEIARILAQSAREYRLVVEMLENRGTRRFYQLSRALYGSASDTFTDGSTTVSDVAHDMYAILTELDDSLLGPTPEKNVSAPEVVEILNTRLSQVFGDGKIRVILDDGIVADAAAGSDYVKVRKGARFSMDDVRILEVHEGWAHVGTSLNGQQQPVARWLSKGPPRTAATQEGLAALLEVLTFASYPGRAHRLNNRVLAVEKAEEGASFYDVFEWFRTEGYDEEGCFWGTQRVFRGGTVDGGAPFTKDIVYMKGVVSNYNFLHAAIVKGRPDLIRWLFVGKVALEDIPALAERAHEGIVRPPRYVPELFRDLRGLAIWLSISTFWGKLNSRAVFRHYEKMFAAR